MDLAILLHMLDGTVGNQPFARWSLGRLLRNCVRMYTITATCLFTAQLLVLAWFLLGTPGCAPGPRPRQAPEGTVGPNPATAPAATSVVLVGTIHGGHATNERYSPEQLRDLIKSARPDLIFLELPRTAAWQTKLDACRLWPDLAWNADYPEGWASASVASDLGVPLLPFDWSERDEFYRRERYLPRERNPRLLQDVSAWASQGPPDEHRQTLLNNFLSACREDEDAMRRGSALEWNATTRDQVKRFRHALWYEIIPAQMAKEPAFQKTADELRWLGDVWQRRNRAMADNILADIAKYDVRRVVVVTGAMHRYILRDLLSQSPQVELHQLDDAQPSIK